MQGPKPKPATSQLTSSECPHGFRTSRSMASRSATSAHRRRAVAVNENSLRTQRDGSINVICTRLPLNDHAPGHLSGRRPHRPVRNPAVATRTGIKIEADGGVDTFKMDFIRARRLSLVMPVTADGVMHRAPARAWTLVPAAGSRLPRSRRMSGCINTAPAAQHLAAGGHPVVSRLQRHPGATTNIIRATGIFPSPPSRIPSPATGCRAWANPRRISGRRTGRRG